MQNQKDGYTKKQVVLRTHGAIFFVRTMPEAEIAYPYGLHLRIHTITQLKFVGLLIVASMERRIIK
jgi:hypothetical protein